MKSVARQERSQEQFHAPKVELILPGRIAQGVADEADPMFVATALVELRKSKETLLPHDWVVVFDVMTVRAKVTECGESILCAQDSAKLLSEQ